MATVLRAYWKQGLALSALVVLGAFAWIYRDPLQTHLRNIDEARLWFHNLGPVGPVVLISLNALQIVVAPIPGYLVQIAAGWVYGVWPGALYAIIGMAVGATLAISLGRLLGRPFVARIIGAERMARWEHITRADKPWLWAILFLGPLGDLPYYLAGLSSYPIRKLVLTAVLVRSPGVVLATALGAGLVSADGRALLALVMTRIRLVNPWWLVALVMVLAVVAYLAYRVARRLPALWERQIMRVMQTAQSPAETPPILVPDDGNRD